ncbi:hypothetical protein ACSBOB_01675 [Mesorhizobium sp. ASY16-5R]|uniref:hypothetical protein n=1 Tax=Mesorhizobium sp. ASY16-5R TaxID=3445772 RepID=UPI003F9FB04A
MTPLADLIAHWQQRACDCAHEISEIVDRYNFLVSAGDHGSMTDDDLRRMTGTWEVEWRIARDTASWLETLQNRMNGGRDAPGATATRQGWTRGDDAMKRIVVSFDVEKFDQIRARAVAKGTSFAEQVRLLTEWGLEVEQI